MRGQGGRSNCDAPRQKLPKAKAIRRESEGKEFGVSVTSLGSMAIGKGERGTNCDENPWCLDFNGQKGKEDGS